MNRPKHMPTISNFIPLPSDNNDQYPELRKQRHALFTQLLKQSKN